MFFMQEFNVDVCGRSFYCISGAYINGNFLAIPEENVCANIGDYNDIGYNLNQILSSLDKCEELGDKKLEVAQKIAQCLAQSY